MTSFNRIEMAVDTRYNNDEDETSSSPLFMIGCLSPSKTDEVAEPPTKIFEQMESPKCASLLAFSHDDDTEDDSFLNNNSININENDHNKSFDATASSVGLMATGLAWVRSQKTATTRSPRSYGGGSRSPSINTTSSYNTTSLYNNDYRFPPIEQQLKERLEQQKRLDRLNSLASCSNRENHYSTPSRRNTTKQQQPSTKLDSEELDKLQIQSCPTSPSFMSRVYSNFTRIPLSSNNSISNGSTTSSCSSSSNNSSTHGGPAPSSSSPEEKKEEEESSPQRTQLTPRLNPVNNIYSFSNIMTTSAATPTAITPKAPTHSTSTTPNTLNGERDLPQPPQQQKVDITITTPRSYFCQEEEPTPTNKKKTKNTSSSKSPTRSALIQVLARIGSGENPESTSLEGGEDEENDSIVEDDDDDDDDEDDIHGVSWIPPVRCVAETRESGRCYGGSNDQGQGGLTNTTSSILSPQQMHQIARHVLPKGIATCQWKRLYSLVRDGDSFDVCLHYAQKDSRTLLVIRTTRGAILGGYAGDVWHTKAGEGYYGTSDTCLFTFEEDKKCDDENDDDVCCENVDPRHAASFSAIASKDGLKTPTRRPTRSVGGITASAPLTPQSPPLVRRPKKSLLDQDSYEASLPPVRVYRYTGVNRYIQYCDANKQMMAFGGGGDDGSFGLCVEQEFQGGSTGPCDTFDNEPLCDQENFKIVDVELWGFLTGQF